MLPLPVNLSFILAHGLVSAHELAESMFVSPGTLPLRNQRLQIEGAGRRAILNHQLPILHGLNAANAMVEGHTAQTWAAAPRPTRLPLAEDEGG